MLLSVAHAANFDFFGGFGLTGLAAPAFAESANRPEAWTLSARERQIVKLVAEGLNNQEIGDRTFLSVNTVRSHLHSIFNKMQLSDRFEVALWAVANLAPIAPPGGRERRRRRRFAIQQPARYRREGLPGCPTGSGTVTDISASGLWLVADAQFVEGEPLRLWIDWPVLLNEVRPLQLVIDGGVIRAVSGGAAVRIDHREFRTRPCSETRP
jgi:DNA-binding CsgD family transcriptional regulator